MKGSILAVLVALTFTIPAQAQFAAESCSIPRNPDTPCSRSCNPGNCTPQPQASQNMMGQYNLAQRMATAPSTLHQLSQHGQQTWTQWPDLPTPTAIRSMDQCGIDRQRRGGGEPGRVSSGPQISGYSSLSLQGQQAIAAQGATLDLGDAVNTTSLQTIGTVRANAPQREADIKNWKPRAIPPTPPNRPNWLHCSASIRRSCFSSAPSRKRARCSRPRACSRWCSRSSSRTH